MPERGGDADEYAGLSEFGQRAYPVEERPFSKAWRRAIRFNPSYQDYFRQTSSLVPLSYRAHPPMVAKIKKDLDELPSSDAIFLAALVSFYNGDAGARLLRGLGASGLSDIAASLDQARRGILADLLVNYCGW